jgi:hypothetical protein
MSGKIEQASTPSCPRARALLLAYVAGIRVFKYFERAKAWMPGTRPGMTE